MKKPRVSSLELQVLSVLWETGPATVRQLLLLLPDGKKRAYTSLLSVLQVMEKKQLLTHDRKGLAHVYRPLVSDRKILRPFLQELTHNVFGHSPTRVMQFLLEEAEVTSEELAEMRSLLARLDDGQQGASEESDGS